MELLSRGALEWNLLVKILWCRKPMQFLGLHLEKNSLMLALVVKERKQFKVKFIETLFLKEEEGAKELKQLFESLSIKEKAFFTISALETHSILLRSLEMPLKSTRDLLKTLPFQLENIIPYPLEEVIVIPSVEKISSINSNDRSIVTLFCCHDKLYLEHLEKFKHYGIDSHWVGCVPQALYRFSKYYTEEEEVIILHMSSDATHIVAILQDKPRHSFQIEIGKKDFLDALQQDMPIAENKEIEKLFYEIELLNIPSGNFFHFSKLIDRFLKEIERVFYFLLHKKEGRRLDKIFLAKEENFLISFKNYIEKSLDISLQIIESKHQEIKKLKSYAISIGLAIDVLSNDHKTLQFKKLSDAEQSVSSYILKTIKLYAFSCVLAFVTVAFSSHLLLKHKEKTLDKKLSTIMERYPQEVAEFGKKIENQPFFSRLNLIEKHFNKVKKPYGYYLTPTHVSDFLEYLWKEEKLLTASSLKIEQIDYELVQYPIIEKPLEPYKIKVQLTIVAEEERVVENFFEKLVNNTLWLEESPNPLLIKENDGYQAIFFLKTSK